MNGHSAHPIDEWVEWVNKRHAHLVNDSIDTIMARTDLTDDDLPAAYLAAGSSCIFAGSQLLFDIVTGAIYGPDLEEPFRRGVVLHNIEEMRQRGHEMIDEIFDQYKREYEEQPELEAEDEEDTDLDEVDENEDQDEDSESE